MKCVVGSIVLNQCYGKEWLLSEAIVDLVRLYTYCSGDSVNEDVPKHPDAMVEERSDLQASDKLCSNLPEGQCKIHHRANLTV